jgi:hypothetical protein
MTPSDSTDGAERTISAHYDAVDMKGDEVVGVEILRPRQPLWLAKVAVHGDRGLEASGMTGQSQPTNPVLPEMENHWLTIRMLVEAPFGSSNSEVRSHLTDLLTGKSYGPDQRFAVKSWRTE